MIDERSQSPWGMKVALYMFFEGTGAAGWFLVVIWDLVGRLPGPFVFPGLITAVGLVLLGVIFLWLDLGRKRRFYLAVSYSNPSWVSRGSLMVTLFLILSIVYFLISMSAWQRDAYALKAVVGGVSLLAAALITAYPGLLLGSFKPFKLWDSSLFVVLFIILSLLGGTAATLLVVSVVTLTSDMAAISMDLFNVGLGLSGGLLLGSIVTLFTHLGINYGMGGIAKVSVLRILQGSQSSRFIATAIAGWIVPLVLIFPALSIYGTGRILLSAVSAIFLLIGSLILRYVLIVAAIRETVPDIPFLSIPK